MASTTKGTQTVLALLVTALFIINNQARPSLGATIYHPGQNTLQRDDTSQKSPTMRHLTWWKWGKDEETITTAAALPITESSLIHTYPVTTKPPSRWRSWFSSAKDKFSNAVEKVKTELKEAKESYNAGLSFAGSAISSGAKKVGNATISAGRAIKVGAKKFGSMVKTGFHKIKLKFSGENEKFKIVANRLKEKLESGDEKALNLMKKLGINITYTGDKLSGSHIENKNISVTDILRNEGMLSNKTASYHTAVEQPEVDEPASAAENENNVFHSAEDYLDFVNAVKNTTAKTELSEGSSSTHLPTALLNENVTQSTQTNLPSTSTVMHDSDISWPAITPTWTGGISKVSESTPIVPKTAGTNMAEVTDRTTPATSFKTSVPSSAIPCTSESIIISVILSSKSFSAASTSATTESSTLSSAARNKTLVPVDIKSSTSTTVTTDVPTTTPTSSKTTNFATSSIAAVPSQITSTTSSITDTSAILLDTSTTQTLSTTSITTSSKSTSLLTTDTETTTAEDTETTSTISTNSTTTATTARSLSTDPRTLLQTTEASLPIENSWNTAHFEPVGSEDGGTLAEAEPYEPPPFPDIFSDIEVHDRLREFYERGDFSHAELTDVFNFDPDNYEYYDY